MKKLVFMILACVIAVPAAMAKDRFISDNLFTYMHAGPSNEFRIIGSINAGEQVKLVDVNKDSGYSQVVDSRGRKGWVSTSFITTKEGMSTRLPKLEVELSQVKEKLANASGIANREKEGLVDSLNTRNSQISELEKSHGDMSQQLTASQTEVRNLRAKLDTQKDDLLLKYFMYGGGVAGIGLLFGLLLPILVPRKRRSPNGWA